MKVTKEELLKWLREEDDLALAVNNCWAELQDYTPAEVDEMLLSVGYEPLGKMLGGETLVASLRRRFGTKCHNWWLTTSEAMTALNCCYWSYSSFDEFAKEVGYASTEEYLEGEGDFPADWKRLGISKDEPFFEIDYGRGWSELAKDKPDELDILREVAEKGGDYYASVSIAEEGEWFLNFINRATSSTCNCYASDIVNMMGPSTYRDHANDEEEEDDE